MEGKNFERSLPSGYREIVHLNAKDPKLGLILNFIALAVAFVVMAIAVAAFLIFGAVKPMVSLPYYWVTGIFAVSILVYLVLHELTHGAVYRAMTGEKLTFGISWSCAFCGVPNIYTYRRTAWWAVVAPLAVFSAILIPLTVLLYFVNPYLFFMSALVFGLHLGGCSGDIYVLILLAKHKDPKLLMRDTGPEQFLYVPDEAIAKLEAAFDCEEG